MNAPPPDSPRSRSAAREDDTSTLNAEILHPDVPSASAPARRGMLSEDDQRWHDAGVAALAAVSQYPRAVNDEPGSLLVSEVVNAVTSGDVPSLHSNPQDREAPGPSSSRIPRRRYAPEFGADRIRSGPEGTPLRSQTTDGDVGMETIVQELIERTATWQNIATVADDDSDNDSRQREMVMDYESTIVEDDPSPSSAQDDELEDLIRFYPDEEYRYHQRKAQHSPHEAAICDVNLDDFYQNANYDAPGVDMPQAPEPPTPDPIESDELFDQPEAAGVHPASIVHTTTYERNLTIDEFIQRWMIQSNIIPYGFHTENRIPPQLRPLSKMISWEPPCEVVRPHAWQSDFYDLQQMPWIDILKVKRSDARALRDAWYTSYHNLDYSHISHARRLPQQESSFRERSMHTSHKASIEHFQLRNLMSAPAYNTVHFASRSRVFSWTPSWDDARCLIDLTQPAPESGFLGPVKISTMRSAHGLTIAGGFCGEYALRAEGAEGSGAKGLVTPNFYDGITNHIDIVRNRSGQSPMGIFSSNDKHLRVLDCETNVFVSDQKLSRPINCTATSPDSRLRVVIGDSPDAWVIEADSGRPVHPLRGHRDFGFACAWSPDMRHIATSNQDKTVIIWDARTWRALETIDSDVAGYRSLRFSPVGGGPRTLLCCEPADRISIVDAQLFHTRQVHDFFGEIGGADYSPDGRVIWVANTDRHFGGFMQYERRQWGQRFGPTDLPNEWAREAELDGDERCVLGARERQLRFLRNLSDEEHDALLL